MEVVDITDDSDIKASYRLQLEGIPNAQARPILGIGGFYNPNSKAKTAFKANVLLSARGNTSEAANTSVRMVERRRVVMMLLMPRIGVVVN